MLRSLIKFLLYVVLVPVLLVHTMASLGNTTAAAIVASVPEFFSHIAPLGDMLGNLGLFSFAIYTSIGSYTSIIKGNSVRLIAPVYYLDHYCYECGRLHKTRQIVEADYLHYCSFSSKYDVEGDNVVTTIDSVCDECHEKLMADMAAPFSYYDKCLFLKRGISSIEDGNLRALCCDAIEYGTMRDIRAYEGDNIPHYIWEYRWPEIIEERVRVTWTAFCDSGHYIVAVYVDGKQVHSEDFYTEDSIYVRLGDEVAS